MHQAFLVEFLRWLDSNLDRDISIDEAVHRSGYSSAQLYRIFKANMNCSLKDYIMHKRLLRCAYALKFTTIPINELSYHFHYATPQAFTRFFKSFFGVTPVNFRQDAVIDFKKLFSWRYREDILQKECKVEYQHLDITDLIGVRGGYELPAALIGYPHVECRSTLETEFQNRVKRPVSHIYTLCKYVRSGTSRIHFDYDVGTPCTTELKEVQLTALPAVSGDYLKFTFTNHLLLPSEKADIAYWGILSINGIRRRDSYHIEWFDYSRYSSEFGYDYVMYIPVVFDDNLINLLIKLREGISSLPSNNGV